MPVTVRNIKSVIDYDPNAGHGKNIDYDPNAGHGKKH
jgi:hypothetical protein